MTVSLANFKQQLGHIQQIVDPRLQDALDYVLARPGKQLRAKLVFATACTLGLDPKSLEPAALAIELVHSYSLVHDDLPAMDNDELRRGQPSCHIAFDEATAILLGDGLQCLAFEILSDPKINAFDGEIRSQMILKLSQAIGLNGMVGGQSLDMSATRQSVPLLKLQTLHQLKTGRLYQACVALPLCAKQELPKLYTNALHEFALNLGLAFQIQDDILDCTKNTEELGKPAGSDHALNKSTYPELLGLKGAKEHLQVKYQAALDNLSQINLNTAPLAKVLTTILAPSAHDLIKTTI